MKAREIREHFMQVGHWVDWNDTWDHFLHGDPEVEVEGVAVAWMATNAAIEKAGRLGHNLFITHEPIFYSDYDPSADGQALIEAKRRLLDHFGMTVLRCHDT